MAGESVPGGRSSAITRASSWRGTPVSAGFSTARAGFFDGYATTLDLFDFLATEPLPARQTMPVSYSVRARREITSLRMTRRAFPLDAAARFRKSRAQKIRRTWPGRRHEHPGAIRQR